jgi:hypothetical protein
MAWIDKTVLLVMMLAAPATLFGQTADSVRTRAPFWASGMSVGIPGATGGSLNALTIGANSTRIGPRPGFDLAVVTLPQAFAAGFIPRAVRAGVAKPIPVGPDAYIIPGIGGVIVGAMSSEDAAGTAGAYAGAAFMAFGKGRGGVRVAYNVHLVGLTGIVWLAEVGFVMRPGR